MPIGTVRWFNARKGYGFILPEGAEEDSEGNDIFVHYSSIDAPENTFRTLYHGEKVEFQVIESEKGKEAKEVTVLDPSPRRLRYQNKDKEESQEEPLNDELTSEDEVVSDEEILEENVSDEDISDEETPNNEAFNEEEDSDKEALDEKIQKNKS
jgi:CspA family cold shock protein